MIATSRMKKRKDFLRVAAAKQKFVTRSLVLQYRKDAELQQQNKINIGFTVTKRQGNAVIRNRIKRRLKEAIRLYFAKQSKLSGYELVVIGRHTAYECPYQTIEQDVNYALNKLAKLKKEPLNVS